MISHGRGGGCARHIRELAHRLTSKALVLLLQTAERNGKLATLTLVRAPEPNRTVMFNQNSDSTDVVEILKLVGVRLIHYHHTVDLPEWLLSLPNYLDAPYYFTAHDQFMVCPQITMTTPNGAFCGEPAESDCDTCLALTPTRYATKIVTWRQKNRDWLRRAESVYVPSHDSRLRFERYFPEISAKVSPPQTNALPKGTLQRVLADSETLKIVVVGAISIEKGADRLERIAKKVAALKLPFVFHLVGYSYRELEVQPNSNLYVHGEYQDHELELLLQELAPDLAWFPGQCPETFSYTLSSCAGFGLPILAPNIGAFPERLANRAMSWVEPVGQSDYDTLETLISIRKLLLSGDAWVISSDSTKRSDGPIDTNLYFDQLSRASAPFDEALLQSIDHRLAAISRSSPCEEVAQK
jgi:O-antigen biosynthesis protein